MAQTQSMPDCTPTNAWQQCEHERLCTTTHLKPARCAESCDRLAELRPHFALMSTPPACLPSTLKISQRRTRADLHCSSLHPPSSTPQSTRCHHNPAAASYPASPASDHHP